MERRWWLSHWHPQEIPRIQNQKRSKKWQPCKTQTTMPRHGTTDIRKNVHWTLGSGECRGVLASYFSVILFLLQYRFSPSDAARRTARGDAQQNLIRSHELTVKLNPPWHSKNTNTQKDPLRRDMSYNNKGKVLVFWATWIINKNQDKKILHTSSIPSPTDHSRTGG